jgi:L-asparagine transporter-like permease
MEGVALLPIRLPFSPWMQIIALAGLVALAFSTLFVDGLQFSVLSFLPFLLLITVFYFALNRRDRRKA